MIDMTFTQKTSIAAAISVALSSVILPGETLAQNLQLEEVVVTAQKRQESMQDIAVAVTAISNDVLEQSRIFNAADLVKVTPSLTVQDGGGARSSSFNIRGIGTQSYSSGVEPSVSTVVDGVVMGRSGMAFAQMMDLKRVEVLRGPQGMLFGKNASAGVVHIITEDPAEELESKIGAGFEDDMYRIDGMFSTPLTDTLGLRIAARYAETDGHIDNKFNGSELNGSEEQAYRVKLRWEPSDLLQFKLSADYAKADSDCCQFQPRITTSNAVPFFGVQEDAIAPVTGGEENLDVNAGAAVFANTEMSGTALEINWDLNGYTLTSITAWRDWETHSNVDVDGAPQAWLDLNEGLSEQEQFTQEFRLTSPADGFLSYVVGAYYFDQDLDREFERELFIILPNPEAGFPGLGFNAKAQASTSTENYAFFGQFTGNISDSVRLIGGMRYTNDELKFDFERTGLLIQGGVPIPPQEPFSDSISDDDTSFKLGGQWDINDDIMVYATWSEGYKAAAYNVIFEMDDSTTPVDPETSESFELGVKSRLLDNQLILNAALFSTTYDDFQSQAQDSSSGQFSILSVGEVATQGLEVDFTARPIANLDIFGGVAWVDTEIEDLEDAPCSPIQVGDPTSRCSVTGSQDVRGESMPFSPEFKLTLSARYLIELAQSFDVVLNGSYRWQDEVLYAIDQDENKIQDAYGVMDLSVGLLDDGGRYEVNLYVSNVFDESYANSIITNNIYSSPAAGAYPYDQFISRDAERRVGVELKYYWY